MEEILKSLQGKSMTKKSLFDFLSEINLDELSTDKPKNLIIYEDIVIHPIKEESLQEKKRRGRKPKQTPVVEEIPQEIPVIEKIPNEKKRRGRKPKQTPVVEEIPKEKKRRGRKPKQIPVVEEIPQEIPVIEEIPKEKKRRGRKPKEKLMSSEFKYDASMIKLKKGIHLIINDLLNKTIGDNITLECKFCKSKFSNKGNYRNHYNYSTMCNSIAYYEFKKLVNDFI